MLKDRDTQRFRGVVIATYKRPQEAQAALAALHGTTLDKRTVRALVWCECVGEERVVCMAHIGSHSPITAHTRGAAGVPGAVGPGQPPRVPRGAERFTVLPAGQDALLPALPRRGPRGPVLPQPGQGQALHGLRGDGRPRGGHLPGAVRGLRFVWLCVWLCVCGGGCGC